MIKTEFIAHFEAVEVPDPIQINGSFETIASEVREQYFKRVLASLQLSHLALQECFSEEISDSQNKLWLKEVQPVALITRSRGEQNLITFSKERLGTEAVTVINELLETDRIISGL